MFISLLNLLLAAFTVAVVVLFITQVLIPVRRGTPPFPLFRIKSELKGKVAEAERELEEETERAILQEKLDELNRRKAQHESK